MTAMIWSAVPPEHCTPEMLAYREKVEPLRVKDDAVLSWEGMPRRDYAKHPTIQHWQAGGLVLFGYSSLKYLKWAQISLAAVYISRSGRVAVRD